MSICLLVNYYANCGLVTIIGKSAELTTEKFSTVATVSNFTTVQDANRQFGELQDYEELTFFNLTQIDFSPACI